MGDCGIRGPPFFFCCIAIHSCKSPPSHGLLSARRTLAFCIPLVHRIVPELVPISFRLVCALDVRIGSRTRRSCARVPRKNELQVCVCECYGIQERHEWEEVTGERKGIAASRVRERGGTGGSSCCHQLHTCHAVPSDDLCVAGGGRASGLVGKRKREAEEGLTTVPHSVLSAEPSSRASSMTRLRKMSNPRR